MKITRAERAFLRKLDEAGVMLKRVDPATAAEIESIWATDYKAVQDVLDDEEDRAAAYEQEKRDGVLPEDCEDVQAWLGSGKTKRRRARSLIRRDAA